MYLSIAVTEAVQIMKSLSQTPLNRNPIIKVFVIFILQPGPSHKKGGSHWGKAKQAAESKKKRSRDKEKSSDKGHRRGRHRDRSDVYAVEYYDNPVLPPAHHRSMEDMTMQYMGYPPFVRTYEPMRTPYGYPQPDVPWHEVRRSRDYF